MMSVPVGLDCCAVDVPAGLECWLMGRQKRRPVRVRHCGAGSRPPLCSCCACCLVICPSGGLGVGAASDCLWGRKEGWYGSSIVEPGPGPHRSRSFFVFIADFLGSFGDFWRDFTKTNLATILHFVMRCGHVFLSQPSQ